MTDTAKATAIELLRAVEVPQGWAYYADEVTAWVVVTEEDILDLGARLERGEDDAYSIWCSETMSDIQPRGWSPHRAGCECGEATGVWCEGELGDDSIEVEWMPEHLRSSHEAAGNAGAWPHNGSVRLRVTPRCAESLAEDAEGWCHEVADK